jgi:hypothetical protein
VYRDDDGWRCCGCWLGVERRIVEEVRTTNERKVRP